MSCVLQHSLFRGQNGINFPKASPGQAGCQQPLLVAGVSCHLSEQPQAERRAQHRTLAATRALRLSEQDLWKGQQMLCDRTLARPWPSALPLPRAGLQLPSLLQVTPMPPPAPAWLRVQRMLLHPPDDSPVHPHHPCLAWTSPWSQSHLCVPSSLELRCGAAQG